MSFVASFYNPWFLTVCISALAVFVWQGEKDIKLAGDYEDLRVTILDVSQAYDGISANVTAEIDVLKKEIASMQNKIGALYMGGRS